MRLSEEDAQVLAEWARQQRDGGLSGYGPYMDAAMDVAMKVLAQMPDADRLCKGFRRREK